MYQDEQTHKKHKHNADKKHKTHEAQEIHEQCKQHLPRQRQETQEKNTKYVSHKISIRDTHLATNTQKRNQNKVDIKLQQMHNKNIKGNTL